MEINRRKRKHAHAIKKILFDPPQKKKSSNVLFPGITTIRRNDRQTPDPDSTSHRSARRTGSSEMPRIVCCLAGARQQLRGLAQQARFPTDYFSFSQTSTRVSITL